MPTGAAIEKPFDLQQKDIHANHYTRGILEEVPAVEK
jgi:hypothetical protein